ncbi:hypothetical protein B0H16DRAFT_1727153 [Mycena metata]|uniref:Uncharacterized protein n=1 Tax=Mycena metata TaxID=1033252 RepID=A0AAD7N401_9AGAR|nr:hypothetical protein B0H16DRAFT_1727153 [Mycena metata]
MSLFTLALGGFTKMDVHRSRAECMIQLGAIFNKHGDLLEALELWEQARPLFEQSSQAKRVQHIDERLVGIGEDVKKQQKRSLVKLTGLNPPVGMMEELGKDSSEDELENEETPLGAVENRADPAVKDFRPKLQEHLLGRLLHPPWSNDGHEFSPQQRNQLLIVNDRIYRHKVIRINYTSYDVRRGQDSMNPRTHADIMMLAPEDTSDDHPFTYARIIGVFHCDAVHRDGSNVSHAVPMSFLWVRRFRLDRSFKGGFKRKRLHRIEFMPDADPEAYGFVDPDEARTSSPHSHTGPRSLSFTSLWREKVMSLTTQLVYRDMFMCYLGGSVGHYQVAVPDPDADQPELPDDDMGLDSTVVLDPEEEMDEDDDDDEGSDDEGFDEDSNEDDESEEEDEDESDGEEDEELDLGPEDGEEGGDDLMLRLGYNEFVNRVSELACCCGIPNFLSLIAAED